MREQQCSNCRYGFGFEKDVGGQCRRYPPVVIQKQELNEVGLVKVCRSVWPFVKQEDWCGEWRDPYPPEPVHQLKRVGVFD